MNTDRAYSSDVAFTPAVKNIQTHKGSRRSYARIEAQGGWQTRITPDLAEFIGTQTSIFLATANSQGQPYIQHRGGPPGFLHVLDERTIAFADFAGNRQYITVGNLAENPKAHLFLIDYATRRRVKLWGTARVVDGDAALTAALKPEGYRARIEQVIAILLSNAIKFGNGRPIEIAVSEDGSRARLAVADHGIGIPTGVQDAIFEPFARAAPSRQYGGLGLGLYIARQIVEALGGAIRVQSAPQQGATFTVELPTEVPR